MDELGLDVQLRVEMDRFEAAMASAGQDIIKFGSDADRGTKRAYDGFTRFEAKVDPSTRALQRLEKEMALIDRGVATNLVSLDREVKARAAANAMYDRTIAKINAVRAAQAGLSQSTAVVASNWNNVGLKADGASRRLSAATSSSRNMGLAVQNAGYQVGDFAVQIASGQGVLRPFIQQGTQLVSMFGPWGAVIGAAGAVVGTLATAFIGSSKAADTSKNSIVTLEEATERLNGATSKGVDLGRDQINVLLNQAKATNILSRARVTSLQSELAAQERELTRHENEIGAGQVGAVLSGSAVAMDKATTAAHDNRNAIKDLRNQINGWLGDIDTSTADIETYRADLAKLADTTDKTTSSTKKHSDAVDKAGNAYAAFIAAQERKNTLLQNQIDGQTDLNPLIKAEAEITKAMGRDLLPKEKKEIERIIEARGGLAKKIDEQKEAQAAADKAVKDSERVWQHWRDNVQDAFADTLASGADFGDAIVNIMKKAAAETVAAWVFSGDASMGGFFGSLQSLIGGSSGASGGTSGGLGGGLSTISSLSSLSNLGSTLTQIKGGVNWISSGLGLGSVFGSGSATAAASTAGYSFGAIPGLNSIVGGAAGVGGTAAGVGASAVASGGSAAASSGLSAAFASIPVAGWIALAASIAKGFVEGSAPGTVKGTINTLLAPSPTEWQNNPKRSVANALDPMGLALSDLGVPSFLTFGGILNKLIGETQPSNKFAGMSTDLTTVRSGPVHYDPDEFSADNVNAVQGMSEILRTVANQMKALTGGTLTGNAYLEVGSRDGIKAGYGIDAASAHRNATVYAGRDAGAAKALDDMIRELTTHVVNATDKEVLSAFRNLASRDSLDAINAGVTTISQYQAAMKALTDEVNPAAVAIKAVTDQFNPLISAARQLGLDVGKLTDRRNQEIAAIRHQYDAQTKTFVQNTNILAAQVNGDDRKALEIQLQQQYDQRLANGVNLFHQGLVSLDQVYGDAYVMQQNINKQLKEFDDALTATTKAANDNAAAIGGSALDNVRTFITGLSTSDLSPLTTQQKAAAAQNEFDRVSGLALTGDSSAISQFGSVAQTLLQVERALYGSGSGYVEAFNKIADAAAQIGTLDPDNIIAKTLTIETQSQTQALSDKLDEVIEAVKTLRLAQSNKPAQAA